MEYKMAPVATSDVSCSRKGANAPKSTRRVDKGLEVLTKGDDIVPMYVNQEHAAGDSGG